MYGNNIGDMAWMDLSVPDAEPVKLFYQAVLGWKSESTDMSHNGEAYQDFTMSNSDNETSQDQSSTADSGNAMFMTGICHAKGANKDIPAAWLPYFLVANLDEAIVKVNSLKGSLITEVKSMGADRYIVIKDPAGASCALYQKG
jgi:predicted enzyme related to lactoylglutathione lyase